jgi:hypothetical protein
MPLSHRLRHVPRPQDLLAWRRNRAEKAAEPDVGFDGADPRARVRDVVAHRYGYEVDPRWEARLHALLGAPWPCPEQAGFRALWRELARELGGSGHAAGTGWDADPAFARAAWCVARHLRPTRVVETGVSRGVTSRCFLEAMPEGGRLWSIDLPPHDRDWRAMTRAAVPERLHERWTYLRGTSRRRLPGLLGELGSIDVFVHDSHHTEPTMRFELGAAWPRLRPGGVLLVDDVHENAAFGGVIARLDPSRAVVAQEEGKAGLLGIAVAPSG